jgi:hypothetical protein
MRVVTDSEVVLMDGEEESDDRPERDELTSLNVLRGVVYAVEPS